MPLLIYDIPYRTGSSISRETLIADGRLQVLAGEDAQIFSTVAEGGAGAIAASAHLQTERFVHVLRLLRAGRLADARAHWQPLLPLIEALFGDANPGPLKAVLANEGMMRDELRAPMTRASDEIRERLLRIQAALSRP